MSNIKRLTLYEDAMETVCEQCIFYFNDISDCSECAVHKTWHNILDENKTESEE